MARIKFGKGEQRKFIEKVMEEIDCPSLRELSRRMGISYSTLKNYFVEERILPGEFFDNLLLISKISKNSLKVEFFGDFWGQVKGGKKTK